MLVELREVGLLSLDELTADGLALFIDRTQRPLQGLAGLCDWRLCGQLSRVLETGFFEGQGGETLLMPTSGRLRVLRLFAFGLGEGNESAGGVRDQQLRRALDTAAKAGLKSLALSIDWLAPTLDEAATAWSRIARTTSLDKLVLIGDLKVLPKAIGSATAGDSAFQVAGDPEAPASSRATQRS